MFKPRKHQGTISLFIRRQLSDYLHFSASMRQHINEVVNDNIEYQINRLNELTKSVIEKKKTCEDEIRRFVNVNFKCGNEFEKDKNQSGINLNNAMRDFIIAIQTAFFKNL